MYRYTYEVHRNKTYNIPLHIVEVCAPYISGMNVFNSAKDAQEYISKLKTYAKNNEEEFLYDFDLTIPCAPFYQNLTCLWTNLENHQIYGY